MGNKYHFKTFEEWCIENNRYDYLDLWDYDKNDKLPSEVPAGTKIKYYFKCPEGVHESESRRLLTLTDKPNHRLICKQCYGGVWGRNVHRADLTGKQFGELTVLRYDQQRHDNGQCGYWICQCSCTAIVSVSGQKLKNGSKKICFRKGKHLKDKLPPELLKRSGHDYYVFKKEVKTKYNNVCIITGEKCDEIEIHHIFPYSIYPELRYDINNGICISKKYHSTIYEGSYHRIYGTGENNTPENFQKYVNEKRRELGIDEYFDVYEYMNDINSDNLEIDDTMIYSQ